MNDKKRRDWEESAIDSRFKTVKIVDNPINPSLYDLSGKILNVIMTSGITRQLFLQETGEEGYSVVDVIDCEEDDSTVKK
jgi:hypothetical protein